MRPQLITMRFVTYLIAGLYSTKWFATCFEGSNSDRGHDATSSAKLENNENFHLENSTNDTFLYSDWDLTEGEPLISDILYEESSWNTSHSHKRDIKESGFNHATNMYILQMHNIYRSNVTPPAGNMEYMEWDEELARLAQNWSDSCVFDHGMPENNYPGPIGQNLYFGTDRTGYNALWMWYEEYLDYDLRKQICSENKKCGHYVQMAWATSNKLGCGIAKCGNRYLMTCHYFPPALRGDQMYHVAKPCSQCSSKNGALCLKNLCISWDQCEANPFDCQFARCELECLNCGNLDKENCLCECVDGWDSPDCSYLCGNKHVRCGKNPGFPTKQTCSLNQFTVAEKYCRQMCEMCRPVDKTVSNNTCCDGTLCKPGYVLDLDKKSCECELLCPGTHCNGEEGTYQASVQISAAEFKACPFITLWLLPFLYIYKEFKIKYI